MRWLWPAWAAGRLPRVPIGGLSPGACPHPSEVAWPLLQSADVLSYERRGVLEEGELLLSARVSAASSRYARRRPGGGLIWSISFGRRESINHSSTISSFSSFSSSSSSSS